MHDDILKKSGETVSLLLTACSKGFKVAARAEALSELFQAPRKAAGGPAGGVFVAALGEPSVPPQKADDQN